MGLQTRLHAGEHVGVHAVADQSGLFGMRVDLVEPVAQHDRVRLPDVVGDFARGGGDHRRHRAGGRDRPFG